MRLEKALFGQIKVVINGLNLDRIFRIVKKNNIEIKNIQKNSYKQMTFFIKSKGIKHLKTILNDYNYEVNEEGYYGISFLLHFFKKRLGILIGIGLFFLLTLFFNSFIWNIEVYGIERLKEEQIITALAEKGIAIGEKNSKSSLEEIERYLETSIKEISMVSMIKKGTSILVNIQEVRVPIILQNIGQVANLVASTEGVITKINVVQGTPQVKVGDIVKKGDVLIAGYFNNVNGIKTSCIALGEVLAKVWYTSSVQFNTSETKLIQTGKKVESVSISINNTSFKVKTAKIDFKNYEIKTKTTYLFNNNLIPLKLNKTIYYETKPILIEKNFDENKNNIINEALLLAKEKVPSDIIFKKEFTTIEKNGTIYVVSAFVECEEDIQVLKT